MAREISRLLSVTASICRTSWDVSMNSTAEPWRQLAFIQFGSEEKNACVIPVCVLQRKLTIAKSADQNANPSKKMNGKSFHLVKAPQWWEKARLCWRTATKPAAMIKIWHFNLNNTWGNEWLTFTWNQIRLRPIPQMPLNLSTTWHSLRGWFHRTIGSAWVPLYHIDNTWATGVWPDSGSTISIFTRTAKSVCIVI